MAKFGFQGSVAEFIELSNSNRIAGLIRNNIASNMRDDNNEYGSWRDGLLKLSNDLTICIRQQPMIGNLHIVAELVFDNQRRADVVICGVGKNGENVYLILELKQWSGDTIEDSTTPGMLRAQVGGSRIKEVHHPLIQAQAYANSLVSNPECMDSRILSGAYLPNMVSNPIIRFSLESELNNNLILNNQNGVLFDLLNSNYSLESETNSSTSALKILLENEFSFSSDYDFILHDSLDEEEDTREIFSPEQERGKFGYIGTKEEFIEDCERNLIAGKIRDTLGINMRETTSEFRSWREGLSRLAILLREVDHELEVACEVSSQAGMIDVILLGQGPEALHIFVIEIKQWSEPGIKEAHNSEYIRANVGGGYVGLTLHPLVQAHRYLRGLMNYNMYFEKSEVQLQCVAFLPNIMNPDQCAISDSMYSVKDGIMVYGSSSQDFVDLINESLINFDSHGELRRIIQSPPGITRYITEQIRYMIEDSENSLVPSGEQQRAIEKIVNSIEDGNCRQVHIIQGGPGTGKTIVGLLSLFRYCELGKVISFIAGNNPTPRVLRTRIRNIVGNSDFNGIIMTGGQLSNKLKKAQIENLDMLLVDEAQSLKWAGMAVPPKIGDMIDKSKVVIYMLDERQSDDPREKVNIQRIEEEVEAARERLDEEIQLVHHTLEIQQRAGAISNLLPWLSNLLGYDGLPTVPLNFPVTVYDSASELRRAVLRNSEDGVECAMTASYCWEFVSKNDLGAYDIILDGGDFKARWNQQGGKGDGSFITDKDRDERVGYPPELQGQELNHTGAILGPDIKVIDGELRLFPEYQAPDSHCFKISGRGATPEEKINYQRIQRAKKIENDREKYLSLLRNQYWIILTRASQHLHLYSEDIEVRNFVRDFFDRARE